jgi:hypothetical protein
MELGVLRSQLAGDVKVPRVTTKQEFSLQSTDRLQHRNRNKKEESRGTAKCG